MDFFKEHLVSFLEGQVLLRGWRAAKKFSEPYVAHKAQTYLSEKLKIVCEH